MAAKKAPTVGPSEANTRQLMTVAEVADELRMTAQAARHLIYDGRLKAYYMAGRRLRVTRTDLETFLNTHLKEF